MMTMTMNNLLAAELNNRGVELLNQGCDLRGALELFRESLSHTAGQLSSFPVVLGVPTPPPDSHPTRHVHATGMLPSTTPFIHSRGINVIPSPTAYSPDIRINTIIVWSIVVFNLAIVCHLNGLEQGVGGNNARRLVRAKSLYERCQCLMADAGFPLGCSCANPVADMLTMASLNNLAHLHYETANYVESKHYFDQLIQFTSTMSSSCPLYGGDAYVASLMDRAKSSFLLNAIILQNKPTLAPAA
jgi:hypothetical protein